MCLIRIQSIFKNSVNLAVSYTTNQHSMVLIVWKIQWHDANNLFIHTVTRDGQLALCRVSKQIITIHELPPILILHMKRFEINYEVRKDDRHISFPEILDMAPYCTSKCVKVRMMWLHIVW